MGANSSTENNEFGNKTTAEEIATTYNGNCNGKYIVITGMQRNNGTICDLFKFLCRQVEIVALGLRLREILR